MSDPPETSKNIPRRARTSRAGTCSRSRTAGHLLLQVRFGERLRLLRLEAQRSPGELALKLNVTPLRLEDIENGIEDIDLVLMEKIAAAFQQTLTELLFEL